MSDIREDTCWKCGHVRRYIHPPTVWYCEKCKRWNRRKYNFRMIPFMAKSLSLVQLQTIIRKLQEMAYDKERGRE